MTDTGLQKFMIRLDDDGTWHMDHTVEHHDAFYLDTQVDALLAAKDLELKNLAVVHKAMLRLNKAVANAEIKRLRDALEKPLHEREPPHCPTCECKTC